MFKHILFVCVGNICRSPMAEYWAKTQLAKKGLTDVRVYSAGIHAVLSAPIAKEAQDILTRCDIDSSQHIATQINSNHVTSADIILTMETWHRNELSVAFPGGHGKMFCLGKWLNEEISDPYLKGMEKFETVFDAIRKNWDLWQNKLWK